MTEPNPENSKIDTKRQSTGEGKHPWPLRLRLLMTAAFSCLAAIGAGVALAGDMSDREVVWIRLQAGGSSLACGLAMIGLWVPLGRWAAHLGEFLRNLG